MSLSSRVIGVLLQDSDGHPAFQNELYLYFEEF